MTTISCPLCAGPVRLQPNHEAACAIGHAFLAEAGTSQLAEQAERALWAAVRALEDQASTVRWRQSNGDTAGHLDKTLDEVNKQAALLRQLLGHREPGVQTQERPAGW